MNPLRVTTMRIAILSSLGLMLIGCGADSAHDRDNIARVKVFSDGEILLDDKTVSISELRSALVELRRTAGGAVWFYRESDSEESLEERRAVMDIIADEGLPTKFSTKPDFSDSVPPFDTMGGASDGSENVAVPFEGHWQKYNDPEVRFVKFTNSHIEIGDKDGSQSGSFTYERTSDAEPLFNITAHLPNGTPGFQLYYEEDTVTLLFENDEARSGLYEITFHAP